MKRKTPLNRHLGEKIRALRMEKHWTQSELADHMKEAECDLSRELIARIESGYRMTSVYEIDKFAEVLEVTYDQLFEQ